QMDWERLQRFIQPSEMQLVDRSTNLKALAIPGGPGFWYDSFVRKDEFFWVKDFGTNLAVTAQISASSENSAGGQPAIKAVDGVIAGAPAEPNNERVTLGQLAGARPQLDWPA